MINVMADNKSNTKAIIHLLIDEIAFFTLRIDELKAELEPVKERFIEAYKQVKSWDKIYDKSWSEDAKEIYWNSFEPVEKIWHELDEQKMELEKQIDYFEEMKENREMILKELK